MASDQKAQESQGPDEEILIHVTDENRKTEKDFTCKKSILLREMKYFEQFLSENDSSDDLDISVHCDVKIFEWLMRYVKDKQEPKLENKIVISVLISSDFLQMAQLVGQCIRYI